VSDRTGFKLPCGPRDQIIRDLAATLSQVAGDPSRLPAMAQAARASVTSRFLWSAKAAQVREVYDWVLAGRQGDKPVFF